LISPDFAIAAHENHEASLGASNRAPDKQLLVALHESRAYEAPRSCQSRKPSLSFHSIAFQIWHLRPLARIAALPANQAQPIAHLQTGSLLFAN